MQRLRVDHRTEYRFGTEVTLLPHRLLLRPRSSHDVRIVSSTLEIGPRATIRWQRDALDNSVAVATFAEASASLSIASSVLIEHYEVAPLDFLVETYAVNHPFDYAAQELPLLAPFREPAWPADRSDIESWLGGLGLRSSSLQTFIVLDRMTRAIRDSMRYEVRHEPGVQSPARTLWRSAGSCRDFASLLMEGCRQLGLASRFVSGYLHAPSLDPRAGATHAWAEIYLPGPGWKGFDPTTGTLAGADHIAVAVAQHPERVPPVAGDFIGPADCAPTMTVTVGVHVVPDGSAPLASSG